MSVTFTLPNGNTILIHMLKALAKFTPLKWVKNKENFSYELAKTELRNTIRETVMTKENLVSTIEEFYKTHYTIHN